MRSWMAIFSLISSLTAMPACPAMASSSMLPEHAHAPRMEHVEVPRPECCLGAPTHHEEQAVVEAPSTVSPVALAIISESTVSVAPLERREPYEDVRVRDPDQKFEYRSKAKRE